MKKTKIKKETYEIDIITALYCDNCNIELNHKTAQFGGHRALYERREYLDNDGFIKIYERPTHTFSEDYIEESFFEIRLCDKCFKQITNNFPCFDRHKYK